jgi:hypothetical protein
LHEQVWKLKLRSGKEIPLHLQNADIDTTNETKEKRKREKERTFREMKDRTPMERQCSE